LCKNVLAAALTPRDFGRVAVPGHFSGFVGSFRLEVLLMRIPAVRFCNSRRRHVCDDYALIAARSGWVPMMFITRVRL
jgi:hypothetical protein